MTAPARPKIYHIVHVDRLQSIIKDGFLWCDAEIVRRQSPGTTIGMSTIKDRRLNQLTLNSHPGLHVGDCVPFYFCPRSVMLYLIYQANHVDLTYRGGQGPIVHLEADLHASVQWAEKNNYRWAFTLSNAGARYFEDRCELRQLNELNWGAIRTDKWSGRGIAPSVMEGKQAEFLIEHRFPWEIVERVGVQSGEIYRQVIPVVNKLPADGRPQVEVKAEWYY